MNKHTAGPWDIQTSEQGTDGRGNSSQLVMICAGDMRIANMHSRKDREANAALIAAAPELYEACKAIEAEISGRFGLKDGLNIAHMSPELRTVVLQARVAISRAVRQ